ncbi:MAG: hypothetical protein ACLP3B_07785 [Syntrophobacteraceae bacterium]
MDSKQVIDDIFEAAQSQEEALVKIYKRYFPDWDSIKFIHGWPTCSKEMWRYICQKFQALDRKYHPNVLPGGAWMNNGFSSTENLKGWELDKTTSQVEYKETHHGTEENRRPLEQGRQE